MALIAPPPSDPRLGIPGTDPKWFAGHPYWASRHPYAAYEVRKIASGGKQAGQMQPVAPQPVTADPRDSTYFQELAKLRFQQGNRLNALQQQEANDRSNLQSTFGNMEHQHPLDIYNQRVGANKQGLLESGILGQRLGQLESSYAQKRFGLQQGFDQRQTGREQGRQQLMDTETLDEANLLQDARSRALRALLAKR